MAWTTSFARLGKRKDCFDKDAEFTEGWERIRKTSVKVCQKSKKFLIIPGKESSY
jgi:hypothetical protein